MDSNRRSRSFPRQFYADSTPAPTDQPVSDYSGSLSDALEDGVVHQLVRKPAHPASAQRRERRPVADQPRGASVGERVAPHTLLEVRSTDRVPDQLGRPRLVTLDDA